MPRITLTTPDGARQPYQLSLDMSVVTIGRDSNCEISINDPTVSDFHAEIRRVPGGFCITDCHSTRGLYIEGERKEYAPLINGQTIQIGDSALTALFTDAEIHQCIDENEAALKEGTIIQPEEILAPPAATAERPVIAQAIPVQEPIEQPQVAQAPQPTATPAPAAAPLRSPASPPPLPGRPGYRPGASMYTTSSSSSGNGMFLFMLLLICACALIAGMTLRHYMETGRLIYDDIFSQEKTVKKVVKDTKPEPVVTPDNGPKEVVKKPEIKDDKPVKEEEKDPMDTAIKSQGKYSLPSVKEFIIP